MGGLSDGGEQGSTSPPGGSAGVLPRDLGQVTYLLGSPFFTRKLVVDSATCRTQTVSHSHEAGQEKAIPAVSVKILPLPLRF